LTIFADKRVAFNLIARQWALSICISVFLYDPTTE